MLDDEAVHQDCLGEVYQEKGAAPSLTMDHDCLWDVAFAPLEALHLVPMESGFYLTFERFASASVSLVLYSVREEDIWIQRNFQFPAPAGVDDAALIGVRHALHAVDCDLQRPTIESYLLIRRRAPVLA